MVVFVFIVFLILAIAAVAFAVGLILFVFWITWSLLADFTEDFVLPFRWFLRFIFYPIILVIAFFFARYPIMLAFGLALGLVLGLGSTTTRFY